MIVLGVLLAALAVLVIAAAASRANEAASLDLGVYTLNTTAVGVFLTGALTLLALVLGLWLVATGLRRGRQKRLEAKQLRQRAEESAQRESELAARPVAPPQRKRGGLRGTRKVREEPVIVREPIEPQSDGSASESRSDDLGASASGSGGATAPDASTTSQSGRSDGPDEHFESAPRER
jgi:hypothetical protein